MDDARERLLSLIRLRAIQKGNFVLSSGEKSDYYIDGRMIGVCPEGAALIGQVLFEELRNWPGVNAIGGLAIGAVPLVAAAMVVCHQEGREIEGFWVRDDVKNHGTKKRIEGRLPANASVAIVDDVVTSGASVMKAIQAVEDAGGTVAVVIALVDRDRGARRLFDERGLRYSPIFEKDELFAQEYAKHSG